MSFQQGLSGLNSSSMSLDVIGNNIANASTAGFKGSTTQFSDLYATSMYAEGGQQAGIGTKVVGVAQQFTQGNITVTNNPLDVAINGDGFFRLSDGGAITYSRNGQFHLDSNGYLVNSTGKNVMGYTTLTTDTNGNVTSASNPGNIQIGLSNLAPSATSTLGMSINLNANSSVIDTTTYPFDPTNANSYNYSTSVTVYDSQGVSHALNYYFTKTAANTWTVNATLDDNATGGPTVSLTPSTLNFNSDGSLNTTATTLPITIATSGLAAASGVNELSIAMDLTDTTQVGSSSGVTAISQNGYAEGQVVGLSIDSNGVIFGRYSNNVSRPLQQLIMANFRNPNGLIPLGDNQWAASQSAGAEVLNTPGVGVAGAIQSGATEDANVDLTNELVNMIVAQRNYQANAQTIKTQDQILQTLVNLR